MNNFFFHLASNEPLLFQSGTIYPLSLPSICQKVFASIGWTTCSFNFVYFELNVWRVPISFMIYETKRNKQKRLRFFISRKIVFLIEFPLSSKWTLLFYFSDFLASFNNKIYNLLLFAHIFDFLLKCWIIWKIP